MRSPCILFISILIILTSSPINDATTTPAPGTSTAASGTTSMLGLDVEMPTMPTIETVTESPTLKTPPTSFNSVFGFPKGWTPIPDGLHQRKFNATDIWFADPDLKDNDDKRNWNTNNSTYQYLGGYYNPATAIIYKDVLELLADAESIIRDVIELVFAVIRLVRCTIVAIFSDEKIQRFERPQTNLFARHMSIFSKRERVDDRLWDSTPEEPEVIRCIKREGDEVTLVLWYILKVFYYVAKVPARGISLIVRLILSAVRIFTASASFSAGIDHHICYVLCQIFSEKAGILCQETCGGVSESENCRT